MLWLGLVPVMGEGGPRAGTRAEMADRNSAGQLNLDPPHPAGAYSGRDFGSASLVGRNAALVSAEVAPRCCESARVSLEVIPHRGGEAGRPHQLRLSPPLVRLALPPTACASGGRPVHCHTNV